MSIFMTLASFNSSICIETLVTFEEAHKSFDNNFD